MSCHPPHMGVSDLSGDKLTNSLNGFKWSIATRRSTFTIRRTFTLLFQVAVTSLCFAATSNAFESDERNIRRGVFAVEHKLAEFVDQETLDSVTHFIAADEAISWSIYVPESYDPDRPAGLIVYISPMQKGWMPRHWREVIDEKNLIWIGADNSGNDTVDARRMVLAVVAKDVIGRDYNIDPNRIYLSGFSGGGKVASMVAIDFANVFKGALYVGGADFWTREPPDFLARLNSNRYVFLAGSDDFNLKLTKRTYRKYGQSGLQNLKLMVIPRMGHTTPGKKDFRIAVEFLDQRD